MKSNVPVGYLIFVKPFYSVVIRELGLDPIVSVDGNGSAIGLGACAGGTGNQEGEKNEHCGGCGGGGNMTPLFCTKDVY